MFPLGIYIRSVCCILYCALSKAGFCLRNLLPFLMLAYWELLPSVLQTYCLPVLWELKIENVFSYSRGSRYPRGKLLHQQGTLLLCCPLWLHSFPVFSCGVCLICLTWMTLSLSLSHALSLSLSHVRQARRITIVWDPSPIPKPMYSSSASLSSLQLPLKTSKKRSEMDTSQLCIRIWPLPPRVLAWSTNPRVLCWK